MQTFLKVLFGVEEKTPEEQIQRMKELMGLTHSGSGSSDDEIICPNCHQKTPISSILKENKEFLIQALNKDLETLNGAAAEELEKMKALIKKIEEL